MALSKNLYAAVLNFEVSFDLVSFYLVNLINKISTNESS